MPIVQYVHPTTQTTVTRTIPVPKKVQELYKGWYREARKWCPQIPPLNEPNVGQYGDGRIYRVQSEPEVRWTGSSSCWRTTWVRKHM